MLVSVSAAPMVRWEAQIPGVAKTTKARTNAVLQRNYDLQRNYRFATEFRQPTKLRQRQNYQLATEFQVGGNRAQAAGKSLKLQKCMDGKKLRSRRKCMNGIQSMGANRWEPT